MGVDLGRSVQVIGNSDEFLQTVNALDALRWWNSSSDKEISQNIRRNENAACGGRDIYLTISIVGKFAVRLSVNWPSLMWTIWSNFGLKFEWFEMWRKHLNDGILLAQLETIFWLFSASDWLHVYPGFSSLATVENDNIFQSCGMRVYMSAVLCSLSLDQAFASTV